MGLRRFSCLALVTWVISVLCLKACGDGSLVSVTFVKAPLALSSVSSASFAFEVLVGRNGDVCRNCSVKCKLDDQNPSNCESKEVAYWGLHDGAHTFEVFINVSQGLQYASYNWTIDTIPPTAYVQAERSFTNALNISMYISFSEPCTGGNGFGCSSVNACNLLVYGPGQVIPSTLKTLQPSLRFSLLVGLSPSVQYGRVIVVMDKAFCTDAAGNRFTRTTNSSFYLHFDRRTVFVNMRTRIPGRLIKLSSQTRTVQATNNINNLKIYLLFSVPVLNSSSEIFSVLHTSNGFLLPTNGKSLGNRRFSYLVENTSSIAIVTISLETGSIISRQGTPVSPTEPVTFLYGTFQTHKKRLQFRSQ